MECSSKYLWLFSTRIENDHSYVNMHSVNQWPYVCFFLDAFTLSEISKSNQMHQIRYTGQWVQKNRSNVGGADVDNKGLHLHLPYLYVQLAASRIL